MPDQAPAVITPQMTMALAVRLAFKFDGQIINHRTRQAVTAEVMRFWDANGLCPRPRNPSAVGTRNRASKLTEPDVIEIKRAPESVAGADLARQYGVSTVTIHKIRTGQSWRHIVVPEPDARRSHVRDAFSGLRDWFRLHLGLRPRRHDSQLD